MTYFFETYGCQMNTAESAALILVLRERGWSAAENGEGADLVLLNTCSVRQTAEQRVLGRLAHYHALKKKRSIGGNPFTLILAGCMAQRLGEALKEQGAVDYVMGTGGRSVFPFILEILERALPGEKPLLTELDLLEEKPAFSFSPFHLEEEGPEQNFRSFVPIMHGCNNYCSYCIVPYVRGREISRSPASIAEEIHLLAERGVREITLLGQNVNSYRFEDALDFPGLLELVARETAGTPIRWVRFLSSHPKDLSSRAIQVMAENPVFCRHLHLCVQHGSNAILSAMNRRYTRERYLELVAEIREAMPDITLSTDILVGFPGETEEDLELTLDLMERVKFLYAYTYHYNPREGTAAYALPDRIGEELKRKRLSRVMALQKKHTQELLKARVGSREQVLIEGISRKNADELIARTERDEMVVVPGDPRTIGSFTELTLSSLRGNTFRAK
ncbi:tRNA-I(6)A37 thiotransferase enzyme MiaB [Treponema primitia ZAS-2]|uniref:tRNA-2-methylthio-N(6)-dimethylallyladenosine synthase n=1 Tax=Treponema primitia (strain ATCC BAA-887 / DSM 12427 / ZAS-2) TaxID=545694 RepID=F5YMU0_TREPZ|nr:tRNA (N6-isopentenyl adenosine(37)-C2)-methylthiotransferase MiaB [Treponema primitia]AEF85198.1 tRNA-I(6)A37 thiotransferase enzyme MiaB [Treponema primitia ZAS-2]